MLLSKPCTKCKQVKGRDAFPANKSHSDGLSSWCKECRRDNYNANRGDRLLWQKQYGITLRLRVLQHYSKGKLSCACCGVAKLEFLAIDHIAGGGAKHRREMFGKSGGLVFFRWLITNDFPDGYRVLCHNCNMSRGLYGYCPHEVDPLTIGFVPRQSHHTLEQEALDAE